MTYTRENIFTIEWENVEKDGYLLYTSLKLPDVGLAFRIHQHEEGVFEIWQRFRSEPPWKLGIHHSLEEAKFYVYDSILYFHLYETGKWNPRKLPRFFDEKTYHVQRTKS